MLNPLMPFMQPGSQTASQHYLMGGGGVDSDIQNGNVVYYKADYDNVSICNFLSTVVNHTKKLYIPPKLFVALNQKSESRGRGFNLNIYQNNILQLELDKA